jgi:aminoglycoside 3-N-acetyltransferase
MKEVRREQVIDCLERLSIRKGDGLLVHSAIQYLGRPVGGVGLYLEAILEVIGPEGTLAAPTFNFSFARGDAYDPVTTPSQGMGAFSEYIRQQPSAHRTPHPMQSLAIIGHCAEDLADRDTLSAFDPGSAFERMLELDFKLLLLGADVSAVSIFHISEQHHSVPYRYWKDFQGKYKTASGTPGIWRWETRTYRMYVRNLELNPVLTADPVHKLLMERRQWQSVPLNYGWVSACRLVDFIAAVDHFLDADPWSLVTNKPSD